MRVTAQATQCPKHVVAGLVTLNQVEKYGYRYFLRAGRFPTAVQAVGERRFLFYPILGTSGADSAAALHRRA